MSGSIEERLEKIPVVNILVRFIKSIKLPGFQGLSLFYLIQMYILGVVKGAFSSRASSIAFSLVMALFPLIIFLVNLVPFVAPYVNLPGAETDFDKEFLFFLDSILPNATSDYFNEIYVQISNQKHGGLLSSAFILSIFLVANGVNAIFSGFENSYHVELTRNFIKQYAYALMVGLILSILLVLGVVGLVYFEFYIVEYISEYVGKEVGVDLKKSDILGVKIAQTLFFLVLTYVFTATLFYFGTSEGRKARFFSAGALMTTLLFILTSYLFGIYVDQFARYNELYGALGGLLILMVYIWLNCNILLLGFELNATINKLKNYDHTVVDSDKVAKAVNEEQNKE
jgi:membrane protein